MTYDNLTPEQLYKTTEADNINFDWQGSDKPERIRYSTDEFAYNSKTDELDDRPLTDEHAMQIWREGMFKGISTKIHLYRKSYAADEWDALAWRDYDPEDTVQQQFLDEWLHENYTYPKVARWESLNRPAVSMERGKAERAAAEQANVQKLS